MKHILAPVVANESVADGYVLVIVRSPEIGSTALPGQFLHISCFSDSEFGLRRPFSIHDAADDRVEILVRLVGRGSLALASVPVGESLDIIGPLGRGFSLVDKGQVLLVGGGCGVAPLAHLARTLLDRGVEVTVAQGARRANEVIPFPGLEALGLKHRISTDDGSAGYAGNVVQLAKEILKDAMPDRAYACGPDAMLQALWESVSPLGIPLEVSVEAPMACGVGACLGCVRKIRRNGTEAYEKVCTCGPVFPAEEALGEPAEGPLSCSPIPSPSGRMSGQAPSPSGAELG